MREITGSTPDTSQTREQGGTLREAIGNALLKPRYERALLEKFKELNINNLSDLATFFEQEPERAKEILGEETLDKDNQSMSG